MAPTPRPYGSVRSQSASHRTPQARLPRPLASLSLSTCPCSGAFSLVRGADNVSSHYLSDCSVPNPLTVSLEADAAEAEATAALLDTLPSFANCSSELLPAAAARLRDAVGNATEPVGGEGSCGGHGVVSGLFTQGAAVGLCEQVAIGFVQLFFWQGVAGAILLVLSFALPVLWHSHHLPPPSLPSSRVALTRALRATLSRAMGCVERPRLAVRHICQRCCRPWPLRRYRRFHAPDAPSLEPELDDEQGPLRLRASHHHAAALHAEGAMRTPMLVGGAAASSSSAAACAPDVEQFLPMATGRASPTIVAAPASASAAAGGTAQEGLEPLVARADLNVCSSHEEL
mgnify:CR=1 FL=1